MTVLDLPSFARFGLLRQGAERATITAIMDGCSSGHPTSSVPRARLRGNRQKVMLGRALTRDLTVFLFDEPSVGTTSGQARGYEFHETARGSGGRRDRRVV